MFGYLIIFLFLAVLTFGGIKFFLNTYETLGRDWYLRIGGGVFIGLAVFTFVCNFVFYFVSSWMGVVTALGLYLCATLLKPSKKNMSDKKIFTSSIKNELIHVFLVVSYILLIVIYSGRVEMGSSSPKYWSYSISIARGNFPSKITWQPDSLMVYHHAPYMVMGVLHHTSGLNISIVHRIFSAYMAVALFLMIMGISRTLHIGLSSILVPIISVILIGGPVIGLFASSSLVDYVDFVVWLGAGVTNLHGMIYANYHLMALGPFLLSIFLINKIGKISTIYEYTLIILLAVLTLSAEEVMAVPLGIVLFCVFIFKLRGDEHKLKTVFFCISLSLIGFFIVQNTIRDSLFTPSNSQSRYRLVTTSELSERFRWVTRPSLQGHVLPNLVVMLALLTVIIAKRRSALLISYLGAGVLFLLLGLFVAQPGFPTNPTRLINYSYALIFFVIGLTFLKSRMSRALLIAVLIPQLMTSHLKIYNFLNEYRTNYYKYNLSYRQPELEWIYNNLKFDSRLLIIDEYPFDRSSFVGDALEYYGLFVPLSPAFVKLDLPEVGMEWFDAVTTLSPGSIRTLKIDTVLVKNNQDSRFTSQAQSDLKNSKYFELIKEFDTSKIFQVKNSYYERDEPDITFEKIMSSIPNGSTVYIDQFKIRDIRKFLLLNLGGRVRLIGPMFKESFDYYIVTEAPLPKIEATENFNEDDQDIDYVLLSADKNKAFKSFDIEYSTKFVSLLKRKR